MNPHDLCYQCSKHGPYCLFRKFMIMDFNDESLIYIFTCKYESGTTIIFNKTLYRYWCKELRNHFSPILINTTHKNVHY